MKRCPKCKRFGVEFDPYTGLERCLWDDCLWINKEGIDIDKEHFKINYKKFRDCITVKRAITV